MIKLRRLIREGFFGRVLSVRLEFGYWVFEGDEIPAQRPSWNYRADEGGGIVLDMFPHWQYLLTDLFGPISAVYARTATHIPRRWDESGAPYDATADDAAYAVLEFASGAFASVNSSWAVRVNRRELLELQVDGTAGSAVSGLRDCAVQHRVSTPMPVWNPDLPDPIDYQALWSDVPDNMAFDNGFKVEWELFLTCASEGRPFAWDLVEGAKGVQLANLALQSSAEGRRLIASHAPELAILDLGLPDRDGLDLLRELRQSSEAGGGLDSQLPVLILSGLLLLVGAVARVSAAVRRAKSSWHGPTLGVTVHHRYAWPSCVHAHAGWEPRAGPACPGEYQTGTFAAVLNKYLFETR